jgi:hypothetical protein
MQPNILRFPTYRYEGFFENLGAFFAAKPQKTGLSAPTKNHLFPNGVLLRKTPKKNRKVFCSASIPCAAANRRFFPLRRCGYTERWAKPKIARDGDFGPPGA